jgi:hypothetical protein
VRAECAYLDLKVFGEALKSSEADLKNASVDMLRCGD